MAADPRSTDGRIIALRFGGLCLELYLCKYISMYLYTYIYTYVYIYTFVSIYSLGWPWLPTPGALTAASLLSGLGFESA